MGHAPFGTGCHFGGPLMLPSSPSAADIAATSLRYRNRHRRLNLLLLLPPPAFAIAPIRCRP
jgi:hypothetical protein